MDFELLFLLKKGGFDGQRQKLGSRMSVLSEQSHGSKQLQPLSRGKADCKYNLKVLLTLDTLTLLCIFSIQFPIHFLRCWQGEFVHQSKASLVASHEVHVWLGGSIGFFGHTRSGCIHSMSFKKCQHAKQTSWISTITRLLSEKAC